MHVQMIVMYNTRVVKSYLEQDDYSLVTALLRLEAVNVVSGFSVKQFRANVV